MKKQYVAGVKTQEVILLFTCHLKELTRLDVLIAVLFLKKSKDTDLDTRTTNLYPIQMGESVWLINTHEYLTKNCLSKTQAIKITLV